MHVVGVLIISQFAFELDSKHCRDVGVDVFADSESNQNASHYGSRGQLDSFETRAMFSRRTCYYVLMYLLTCDSTVPPSHPGSMDLKHSHGSSVTSIRACYNEDGNDLLAVAGNDTVQVLQCVRQISLSVIHKAHSSSCAIPPPSPQIRSSSWLSLPSAQM